MSLARLMFLLACWLPSLALAAPPAPPAAPRPVRGVVTCNGQPVFGALVQGLSDPNVKAPFGETFTDGEGRFELKPKPGANFVVARRGFRAADGELLQLSTTPLPLTTRSLKQAFATREVRSREVPATPEDLQACTEGLAPPDLAEIQRAVADVLAAPIETLPSVVARHRDLLKRRDVATTGRLLDTAVKQVEGPAHTGELRELGERIQALGEGLDEPELRAIGQAWQGVAFLYEGRAADSLPFMAQALAWQQQAVERETRPGWRHSRQALWSTFANLTASLSQTGGDRATAARLWTRTAELDEPLGRIEEAAQAHLNLADLAVAAHDNAKVVLHARKAIDLLTELDLPAAQGKALLLLASCVDGDERDRLQDQAEQALVRAPLHHGVLGDRVQLGQRLKQQGKFPAALRVLSAVIVDLETQPVDALRTMQLWNAVGSLGRADVYRELKQFDAAVADLRRAIPLQPKDLGPAAWGLDHMLLGYSLSDLGRHDESRAELQQAADLYAQSDKTEDREMALTLRSHSAWSWMDCVPPAPDKALAILDPVLADAVTMGALAVAGRVAETASYACTLAETDEVAWLTRGLQYLARAEALFGQAKSADDQTRIRKQRAHLTRLLGDMQMTAGQKGDAEKALREAIAAYDHEGQAAEAETSRDHLALLLYEQARWAEAAELWERHVAWLQTPQAATAAKERLALLTQASESTRRNLEPARQRATTLDLLASCWEGAGRPDKMTATYRALVQQFLDLGDRAEAARVERQLAMGAVIDGDREAFDRSMQWLDQASQTDDERAILAALRAMPALAGQDADGARRAVRELAATLQGLSAGVDKLAPEDRRGFVQAWALLGVVQARLGDPGPGLASLEQASKWAEPVARVAMLGQIGKLCRTLGRLQQALDAHRKVLELQQDIAQFSKPSYELMTLIEVFEVQWALGDVDGARATMARAAEVAHKVEALPQLQNDDRRIVADMFALVGRQAVLSGVPEHLTKAIEALQRALDLYPSGLKDEKTSAARVALVLAEYLQFIHAYPATVRKLVDAKDKMGAKAAVRDYEDQLQRFRNRIRPALEEALETQAVDAILLGMTGLQTLKLDADMRTWWRSLLARAHAAALRKGRLSDLPDLSWALARDFEGADETDHAIATYRRAVDEQEVLRSSLASDTHKAGLLEGRDDAVYGALERLLAGQGKAAEALEVSEQRRARALLDAMATGALRDRMRQGAPSAELQQLAERMQALAAQDEALDVDLGLGMQEVERVDARTGRKQRVATASKRALKVGAKATGAEAEALMQQLGDARRRMAGSTAEIASLVTAPIVTADELRAAAKDRNATLVEWSIHGDRLLTYVVRPDGRIDVRKIDMRGQDLEDLVRKARTGLGASVGLDPTRGPKTWGPTPLKAVEARQAFRALYTALVQPIEDLLPADPNATVIAVPHRSLMLLPMGALLAADESTWVDHASVSVVPSLGLLRYTAAKAKRAAKRGAMVVGNPAMPMWQGQQLQPLAGAEREAGDVAKALKGPGITLLIGAAASETALRGGLAGKRWLHLATHGVTRDDDPGQSFVALAADGKADGLLTMGEVLDLRLDADLVVLSACQTGLGKVSGDGVMGLGRAFLYAGTPRVVVSLWSVPDEPTALLMHTLYAGLRKGLPPAQALRQAMLATRVKYPGPAQWAAFELIGEPR